MKPQDIFIEADVMENNEILIVIDIQSRDIGENRKGQNYSRNVIEAESVQIVQDKIQKG